jgi:hypothetical protein
MGHKMMESGQLWLHVSLRDEKCREKPERYQKMSRDTARDGMRVELNLNSRRKRGMKARIMHRIRKDRPIYIEEHLQNFEDAEGVSLRGDGEDGSEGPGMALRLDHWTRPRPLTNSLNMNRKSGGLRAC